MKKLAIIGGGGMACIFAKNAREMNIQTHCYSLKSGIYNKNAFDYIHEVNILNREKVLKSCMENEIDGVVSTTELTIAVAAYVADRMNLNGSFEFCISYYSKTNNKRGKTWRNGKI